MNLGSMKQKDKMIAGKTIFKIVLPEIVFLFDGLLMKKSSRNLTRSANAILQEQS